MSRFHVFYSAMPGLGSGFRPVEAADLSEARHAGQPVSGAATATLSDKVTDAEKIRKLFMEWLGKI